MILMENRAFFLIFTRMIIPHLTDNDLSRLMKTYVLIPYIQYPNTYSLSYFPGRNRITCRRLSLYSFTLCNCRLSDLKLP